MGKCASWLIALGLIFAIIPRLINLAQVWFYSSTPGGKIDFWLNLIAIIAALVNCFVHSRDAGDCAAERNLFIDYRYLSACRQYYQLHLRLIIRGFAMNKLLLPLPVMLATALALSGCDEKAKLSPDQQVGPDPVMPKARIS